MKVSLFIFIVITSGICSLHSMHTEKNSPSLLTQLHQSNNKDAIRIIETERDKSLTHSQIRTEIERRQQLHSTHQNQHQ